MVATEAAVEFFKSNVTAFVGIEASEHGINNFLRNIGKSGDCAEFFTAEESVFSGDFGKVLGTAGFDTLPDGIAGGFFLFVGDFSVAVGVDGVAALLAAFFAEIFDGLTLFTVNFSVFVGVKLLKEFRQGSISDSLVSLLGQGD